MHSSRCSTSISTSFYVCHTSVPYSAMYLSDSSIAASKYAIPSGESRYCKNSILAFQQQFQEAVLLRLISAVGLDRHLLCRNDFKNAAKGIFKSSRTYHNALDYARQIRNRQTVGLTKSQSGMLHSFVQVFKE